MATERVPDEFPDSIDLPVDLDTLEPVARADAERLLKRIQREDEEAEADQPDAQE